MAPHAAHHEPMLQGGGGQNGPCMAPNGCPQANCGKPRRLGAAHTGNAIIFQISLGKTFFCQFAMKLVMLTKVFTRVTFSNVNEFKKLFSKFGFL